MNDFKNPNVEPWYKWVFRKSDSLPFVTVYFLSRKNSTSPRFFPMYDNSEYFRIVLIRGIKIKGTDRVLLVFHRVLMKLVAKKLNRYVWQSPTSFESAMRAKNNVIMHLDDPVYTENERERLGQLLTKVLQGGKQLRVACTNQYTKEYLDTFLPSRNSIIVPQGHSSSKKEINFNILEETSDKRFRVGYISPFIDTKGDKHEGHEAWDATHLLSDLLPKILEIKHIEIHLIGRLGKNAEKIVSGIENVISYGLIPIDSVTHVLSRLDLGLYPRRKDNFRSVHKITEYIGAGIPILSYKLIDTSLIDEYGIGKCVNMPDSFISELRFLSEFPREYFEYLNSVRNLRGKLKWKSIVSEMEQLLLAES